MTLPRPPGAHKAGLVVEVYRRPPGSMDLLGLILTEDERRNFTYRLMEKTMEPLLQYIANSMTRLYTTRVFGNRIQPPRTTGRLGSIIGYIYNPNPTPGSPYPSGVVGYVHRDSGTHPAYLYSYPFERGVSAEKLTRAWKFGMPRGDVLSKNVFVGRETAFTRIKEWAYRKLGYTEDREVWALMNRMAKKGIPATPILSTVVNPEARGAPLHTGLRREFVGGAISILMKAYNETLDEVLHIKKRIPFMRQLRFLRWLERYA